MKKISITTFFLVSLLLELSAQTDNENSENKRLLKAKALYEEGYQALEEQDYLRAITPFKEAIKLDSTGNCGTGRNGMAYSELGYAFFALNRTDDALIYYEKAIKLNKFIPEPFLNKSVILFKRKEYSQALETLDNLIMNMPEYSIAYLQRGIVYKTIKKDDLALADFETFIKLAKEQNQSKQYKFFISQAKENIKELKKGKK